MIVEGVVSIAIVGVIVEVVKKTDVLPRNFLPLLSIVVGILLGMANSYVGAGVVVAGALEGLVVGAMASGLYDTGKGLKKTMEKK